MTATTTPRAKRAAPARTRAPRPKAASTKVAPRRKIRHWPSVLLGVLWGVALVGAGELSASAVAFLVIPVAALGAVSGVKAAGEETPVVVGVAGGTAVVLPLIALAGPLPALVIGLLVIGGGLAASAAYRPLTRVTLLAGFGPAVAAASAVAARTQGVTEGVVLLTAVCLYDAAVYLTGRGVRGGPIGIACGVITLVVLAVLVAAVMVPPFSGSSPWVILGLVALFAPLGVALMSLVAPRRRLPALRRLDSLVLAGPVWVVAIAVLHK